MTIAEFRAWLEGYEASFDGAPSPEQFATIKDKLSRVYAEPAHAPAPYPWRVEPVLPYPQIQPLNPHPGQPWWNSPIIAHSNGSADA
jgi:hypothetical protein